MPKLLYTQKMMEFLVKELLSLNGGSTYHITTLEDRIELKFKGSKKELQKHIFEWLKIRCEPDERS